MRLRFALFGRSKVVFGRVFLSPFFSSLPKFWGVRDTERDNKKKSESGRKKTRAKETRAHLLDRGLLRGGGLLFCRRGGVDL